MKRDNDLISLYLSQVKDMEAPLIYHTWAIVTAVSTLLGRKVALSYVDRDLYPNLYTLLVGVSACRKSTALNRVKDLLRMTGFNAFSRDQFARRRFMLDLIHGSHVTDVTYVPPKRVSGASTLQAFAKVGTNAQVDQLLANAKQMAIAETENMLRMAADTESTRAHMGIYANELVDFLGARNTQPIIQLNTLYDCPPIYSDQEGSVIAPYITMLSAITPTGFINVFSPDTLNQGLLSRMVMVFSDPPVRQCSPFRVRTNASAMDEVLKHMKRIRDMSGEFDMSGGAEDLFLRIMKKHPQIKDPRFVSWNQRRAETLAKVCMAYSACRDSYRRIETEDVMKANTLMTFTEHFMPDALGNVAFDLATKRQQQVLSVLKEALGGLTMEALYKLLNTGANVPYEEITHAVSHLAVVGAISDSHKDQDGAKVLMYKEKTLHSLAHLDKDTIDINSLPAWVAHLGG